MPYFSVVIPAYNRESLIRATLDSVLKQDFEAPEIIVVDDGSTDGTRDVVESYGSCVQLLRQQNKGPGAARNLGVSRATGRYVCLFDSDDLYFPWTLSTYARVLREQGEPAFLTGQPQVFHDPDELADANTGPETVEVFQDYYASCDAWRWFSASSFVVRRDVLVSVGGCAETRISGEDCDLAMRLGTAAGFVHLRSPVTFGYREHAGSMKSDFELLFRGQKYLIAQEQQGRYPGGSGRRRDRIEILSRHVRPFVVGAVHNGALNVAWQAYRETWRWHLRLGRWKYLLGTPILALMQAARPRFLKQARFL